MPTKLDIIEGHSLIEEFGYVTQLIRRAYVDGYAATTPGQLFTALADLGLPVPGETHPTDPNLILGQRIPYATGVGKAFVDLVYRTKRLIYRGGTQVSQIQTQKKQDGTAIMLTYNGTDAGPDARPSQGVTITPFSCEPTLFAEMLYQTNTPGMFSLKYVNKLNSAAWSGQSAKEWFCTAGHFEPFVLTSAVRWWAFRFEFQLRQLRDVGPGIKNAWQPEAIWLRNDGGYPADASTTNGGIAVVEYYQTENFSTDFP